MWDLTRFYPGDRALECWLVVTLSVTLISSIAWLVAQAHKRTAALRHLALLCALICCLACPAAVWVSNLAGLTIISISLSPSVQAKAASNVKARAPLSAPIS